MDQTNDPRSMLLDRVRDGLRTSEKQSSELKRKNSRYISIGIIASALSTVVAGTAAALGPVIGTGAPAWKLTCGAIAVCTGIATVFSGLQKQFSIAERFAKATACAGKLRSLEFAMTINNRDTAEVAKEYESVLANYSDVLS